MSTRATMTCTTLMQETAPVTVTLLRGTTIGTGGESCTGGSGAGYSDTGGSGAGYSDTDDSGAFSVATLKSTS